MMMAVTNMITMMMVMTVTMTMMKVVTVATMMMVVAVTMMMMMMTVAMMKRMTMMVKVPIMMITALVLAVASEAHMGTCCLVCVGGVFSLQQVIELYFDVHSCDELRMATAICCTTSFDEID